MPLALGGAGIELKVSTSMSGGASRVYLWAQCLLSGVKHLG